MKGEPTNLHFKIAAAIYFHDVKDEDPFITARPPDSVTDEQLLKWGWVETADIAIGALWQYLTDERIETQVVDAIRRVGSGAGIVDVLLDDFYPPVEPGTRRWNKP